mgnify:FL=1
MYFWISTAVYSLVWLLSPQTVRLLLLGLTILGGVLWLFWGGKRRKDKRALYTVCLLLLLAGAGRFLNTPVAQLKFFCLEGMYRQTAQSLCAELREDGDFGFRMDLQGPSFLSNAGQVQALAENGTLALYFPISESFFNSYGYIYAPDGGLEAQEGPFSLQACGYAQKLDDQLAYVKLY